MPPCEPVFQMVKSGRDGETVLFLTALRSPYYRDIGFRVTFNETSRPVDLSGCGEWTKTCEEECVDGGGPIPNLVHFIKTDYVLAASKGIKPKKIFVHSVGEIKSCWWNHTQPLVEHHIVPSNMGKRTQWKDHIICAQSRFHEEFPSLPNIGGISSDTDSIATKSFDNLLHT